MKLFTKLLAITSIFTATSVLAGPPVTVTFKNLGTATAVYKMTTNNEISTYSFASPKPAANVPAGSITTYTVTSTLSTDINYAYVRYSIGAKTCEFKTTFLNKLVSVGNKIPQWTKTATPSGGAVCAATITTANPTTYEWAVEFTMK